MPSPIGPTGNQRRLAQALGIDLRGVTRDELNTRALRQQYWRKRLSDAGFVLYRVVQPVGVAWGPPYTIEFIMVGDHYVTLMPLHEWPWDRRFTRRVAAKRLLSSFQLVDSEKCPGCARHLPKSDFEAQKRHLEREHPEIIRTRKEAAGFREVDGEWIDTLATDD